MVFGDNIMGLYQLILVVGKSGIKWAVLIAGIAVIIAAITAYINYVQTKAQLRPILSYQVKDDSDEDKSGFIKFRNVGQGAGTLLGVDLSPPDTDIKCHIATPLSIGPGSEATLKVWLSEVDKVYKTTVTLYYWDITNWCHATKVDFELEYQTGHKPWFEVREPMEELKDFFRLPFHLWHPKRLKKLHHWDPKFPRKYINDYSKITGIRS
jgi:hypothetical protein